MPLLDRLPTHLRDRVHFTRLAGDVPVLIAFPDPEPNHAVQHPAVLWMHGRTVTKEIDPGRYMRWIRAGMAVCAVDLPGHGERFSADLQLPERTLDVVLQMADEIDAIAADFVRDFPVDASRLAIGGMSAGGMATLTRLTHPHEFAATSVEATTGSWINQSGRAMFRDQDPAFVRKHDPIQNLDGWRPIPFQAFHCRIDEWVAFAGQERFVDALRVVAPNLDQPDIDFVVYEETGAPFEHAGFGRYGAVAKNRQRDWLSTQLAVGSSPARSIAP